MTNDLERFSERLLEQQRQLSRRLEKLVHALIEIDRTVDAVPANDRTNELNRIQNLARGALWEN